MVLCERAMSILERTEGTQASHLAGILFFIAPIEAKRGADDTAAEHYTRVLAMLDEDPRRNAVTVSSALLGLADIEHHRGRLPEAIALAERAVGLLENDVTHAPVLAEARFNLARLLDASGEQRDRAVSLATRARDEGRVMGNREAVAEVEAWLSARAPHP
jgi:tetratricopeptide (TPR) repeat protein